MKQDLYKNEIAKRRYYKYLEHSRGSSRESIKHYKSAISSWQEFTNNEDFSCISETKIENFKEWLKNKNKKNSSVTISLSHRYDILRFLKIFFNWLSDQTGYKSKITKTFIDYFNLTMGEVRQATQQRNRISPTMEEAKILIESIKGETEIERRDKALISLVFLTGIRISALSSLPIESFDKENLIIDQDPRLGVKTKNTKKIMTSLIPFSYQEPLNYFLDWYNFLINIKNFKQTDPLFPATKIESGNDDKLGYYSTEEISSNFWKNTSSPRKIFENRFKQAGLKYYHPHTFRNLIVKEFSKLPLSEEERKAISQNLGHADVETTFGSYGYNHISEDRQFEIIKNIDFNGKRKEIIYQITADEIRNIIKKAKE